MFVDIARDAIAWADFTYRPKWQRPFVLVRVGWFLCELVVVGVVLIGPFILTALLIGYLAYAGFQRLLGH